MMKAVDAVWQNNGFTLRLAQRQDAEAYYEQNFHPLEPETARLTGCKAHFSRAEVVGFFLQCLEADDRYDFLILSPDGRIIGESVINEIDFQTGSANFRIALFHAADCGQGIGSWAVGVTRDFAFERLGLHRLELQVFSFNPRAEKAYRKAGFRREGVLREAVRDGDGYGDIHLMALLEQEWREEKGR